MKNLLLAIALSFIGTPLLADVERPEDMVDRQVPIMLHCFPSFARVVELLARDYQEAPVMLSYMSPYTTMVWFTNKDRSTSTLVVTKSSKDAEESCIMWNGASEPGMSFSLNPEPNFPEKGTETNWNEI
tara:strand:+ start:883 stop:1269 length:387 start_codon:yes stop_codon:yes gene_type:complete